MRKLMHYCEASCFCYKLLSNFSSISLKPTESKLFFVVSAVLFHVLLKSGSSIWNILLTGNNLSAARIGASCSLLWGFLLNVETNLVCTSNIKRLWDNICVFSSHLLTIFALPVVGTVSHCVQKLQQAMKCVTVARWEQVDQELSGNLLFVCV